MKKLFPLISIALCLSIATLGQTPQPTPFPENWQTMGPEREFSIEVPIALEIEKDKEDKTFRYSGKLNDTYFFIFSEERSEASGTKVGLRYIKGFQASGEKISFGNLRGDMYGFRDDEGFFQRALYIEIAKRAYLFHTVSEKNEDETVQRFFRSLMIRGRASSSLTDLAAGPSIINEPAKAAPAVVSSGTGIRGDGSGSGLTSLTKSPVPPGIATGVSHKVKISTKPLARYTDAARTYGIQGTVVLRTTFLANGTIGGVAPVSKLPMGLTNTAIDAARSITFDPARRNDVPYTTMITIVYSFTIY